MKRIALVTDFGTRDPYVAAVKGVIASRTDVPVVDLTHEIAPHDVFGAAWFLRAVVDYWPAGTIFVCVVDPGVGTSRRIIAAESDGKVFLAPDNGLLGLRRLAATFSVENESLFLPNGSTTFHGRDRFAPVAAAIANGFALTDLGPRVSNLVRLNYDEPQYGKDRVKGSIVAVDRFGNLITDIEAAKIPFAPFAPFALEARDITIDRVERAYAGAAPGAFLIVGSYGCLEISVANGSAAERLQLRRLERVEVVAAGVGSHL
ncbi:MAG TPA: SAM-dependent chlorinase/fluorinase [Thermoanaerobaculia bacterium]|nr:SAM-dependent chlorinase/fluorinase [Thermoanaerobaculia bacterium]